MNTGPGTGLSTDRPTRSSRRKRALRTFLIITGGFTLGVIALIVFALIQLSGGLPWALTVEPKETDEEVVAANSAGDAQRDILVSSLQAAGATAGLAPVAKTSPALACRKGQHNFKVNNDYDLECNTTVSVVLGSTHTSETALRTQLLTFHDQLTSHGWQSSYETTTLTSIKEIIDQPLVAATPGSPPFLGPRVFAFYFQGERGGGQGSAMITISFSADQSNWVVRGLADPPNGTTAEGEPDASRNLDALRDTRKFMLTAHTYIVKVGVTYVTFSG